MTKTKSGYEKLTIIFLFIIFMTGCANTQTKWPQVNNFKVTSHIDATTDKILLEIPILNHNNNQIYLFICRGESEKYLDQLYQKNNLLIVPPLNCALYLDTENEISLLSEDDSEPWHSRGQIFFNDIIGDCGNYPEFGINRNFDLRGFRLTISFKNIETNTEKKVTGFDMTVTLRSNSNARSPRAGQTGFLPPKFNDCKNVRRGHETLKCRDLHNDYSWIDCSKN